MACTPPGCRREPGEGARPPGVAPPVNLRCPFGASGQWHQGDPHFSDSLLESRGLRSESYRIRRDTMAATTSLYAYVAAGHHQIAFVVNDLQAAERFFTDKMGVPRFCRFNDVQVHEPFYRGGPGDFHMHLSLGYAGDSQIELIEHL